MHFCLDAVAVRKAFNTRISEVHNCWLEIQQIKPCLAKDIIFLPHLFNIFVSYGETKVKTETNLKKWNVPVCTPNKANAVAPFHSTYFVDNEKH